MRDEAIDQCLPRTVVNGKSRFAIKTRSFKDMNEPRALDFDNASGMLDDEDETALAAIDEAIAEIDAGREISLSALRKEISERCTK